LFVAEGVRGVLGGTDLVAAGGPDSALVAAAGVRLQELLLLLPALGGARALLRVRPGEHHDRC
jgi:hypothetical protein